MRGNRFMALGALGMLGTLGSIGAAMESSIDAVRQGNAPARQHRPSGSAPVSGGGKRERERRLAAIAEGKLKVDE